MPSSESRVGKIYFDITDIVHFARRSNRLTGIQRVEFNLINLLAAKHGGEHIRCIFFQSSQRRYYEFDPATRAPDAEFDAERLLLDLGLMKVTARYPSKVQIKGYLRTHARNKRQRVLYKLKIYLLAWLSPEKLAQMGLSLMPVAGNSQVAVQKYKVDRLPENCHLVHLGSSWFFPEAWRFAAQYKLCGGDVVQYVHDLIPVTHPEFMPAKEPPMFTHWLEQALSYATRFPCNSRWTANDLQQFARQKGAECSLHVVPLAHEFMGFARNSEPALPDRLTSLAGCRFVLCVGTIEARKNGLSLLKAWQQLMDELGTDMPMLVFAGRYGKIGGDEFRDHLQAHPELQKLVRVVDGPSDQAMAWMYRNCLFSTYPSHVEGWGLPVGESAWFGRYCVASQASSIPEVCGELAGYVNPNDLSSIKAGILKPITDPAYLREREAAIAAAPLRTWSDVADDLYAYIVGKSH